MQLSDLRRADRRTLGAGALIVLGVILFLSIELWPLFIILPGAAMLAIYYLIDHDATGPFAIPGMIVTGTGMILFVQQNLLGGGASWSYAWTLYGVFFGVGMMMMGQRFGSTTIIEIGRWFAAIGGIGFVALGAFVILLTSFMFKLVVTLVLIGVGAYLLSGRDGFDMPDFGSKPKNKRESDSVVEENIEHVRLEVQNERDVA
jgi:hypothetical protein